MITPETALTVEERTGFRILRTPRTGSELEQRMADRWGLSGEPWTEGQCRVCGRPLAPDPVVAQGLRIAITVCPTCAPAVHQHYTTDLHSIDNLWRKRCPERYREAVTRQHLPAQTMQPYQQAVAYQFPEGQGLILRGESGTGKTVCLWHIARQLDMSGSPWEFRTAVQLGRELARSAKDMELDYTLAKTPFLLIDDLGKEKLTASVAASLWELIEYRTSRRLPIIATTRYAGDTLVRRFSEQELGQDIAGRLREGCMAILFKQPIL